jgi:hypothetical protein
MDITILAFQRSTEDNQANEERREEAPYSAPSLPSFASVSRFRVPSSEFRGPSFILAPLPAPCALLSARFLRQSGQIEAA